MKLDEIKDKITNSSIERRSIASMFITAMLIMSVFVIPISPVSGATSTVFSTGFESGSVPSELTESTVDGSASVQSTTALNGSYSAKLSGTNTGDGASDSVHYVYNPSSGVDSGVFSQTVQWNTGGLANIKIFDSSGAEQYSLQYRAGSNTVQIYDHSAGSTVASTNYTLNSGTKYDLKAKYVGNKITLYSNGTEVLVYNSARDITVKKTRYQISVDDGTVGYIDDIQHNSYSTNSAPTASFTDSDATKTVTPNTTVTIDAGASSDPDGDSLTYSWDGPDSDSTYDDKTGSSITVSKSSNGTYNWNLKVSDGSATDTATYTLNVESGSMDVTVNDASGTALSGATVDIVNSSGTTVATKNTDSNGVASFSQLATGDYTLNVSHPDFANKTGVTTSISNNTTTTKTIQLSTTTTTAKISGVTDSVGNSLSSFDVSVVRLSDGSEVRSQTGVSAPMSFNLDPQYDYDVTVSKSDYSSQTKQYTLSSGSTTSKSFSLAQETGSLDVTVTANDTVIDGATVKLLNANGDVVQSTKTDSSGVASFTAPTNDYTVDVTTSEYGTSTGNQVTITTDSTATLSVSMTDSTAGGGSGTAPDENIYMIVVFGVLFIIVSTFIAVKD
ncbi:carboxypeptidase regulatory-like domain-containing protein [Halobacterium noricense]|uniref:carboxypeptidase regulatory-like domain-containing protein n=1 Tax=Halobacterium noricense TaxID=223182 RepID=UPI001E5D9813|nr:carboxypeptidase regulatory-like domain-containing protein [Halobacterium noricense]UHH25600.1 carboxypeptidase regulatory-like domain-containing protein [Halobacterium noricense]